MEKFEILSLLEKRFNKNAHRHKDLVWSEIVSRLTDEKLEILAGMEETGGEPDITIIAGKPVFVDFAKQTPSGRRNCCFDEQARLGRKKFPPQTSVEMLCSDMRIKLLTEDEYRKLQEIEELDTTTSSWIATPDSIRELGGALFCDRRYKHTFTYHNGADSYYSSRGFRGKLEL